MPKAGLTGHLQRTSPWGIQLGQLDDRMPTPRAHAGGEAEVGRAFVGSMPLPLDYSGPLRGGLGRPVAPSGRPGRPPKIVTWLILPVVICLSQRLSHACLSISNYTVKLRMAH